MTKRKSVRAQAAIELYKIIVQGRSLNELANLSDPQEKSFLHALCYGVCRWYFYLDAIAQQLLTKPVKNKDLDLYMLILLGLYQLIDMRVPDYAAITETVNAAEELKKNWAKGWINGVLREYQRRDKTNLQLPTSAIYSHPSWMINLLQECYPQQWEIILKANNEHPPFSLRVNQQKISRELFLKKIFEQGIQAEKIAETENGVILAKPLDVKKLPGFAEGMVSIQDGAAQLAAELLTIQSQENILDACAAPGGKAAHLLEAQPNINLIAVDQDSARVELIKQNLTRLQLSAECITADVANLPQWWQGQLFDHILLDAPCSASGVIRRHPDIKIHRRLSDIPKLAATQLTLLRSLWPTLKKTGLLLYVTCSIFPEENEKVILTFLSQQNDAQEEKIKQSWGIDCKVGKQILPGMHDMDGFYFALLRKD